MGWGSSIFGGNWARIMKYAPYVAAAYTGGQSLALSGGQVGAGTVAGNSLIAGTGAVVGGAGTQHVVDANYTPPNAEAQEGQLNDIALAQQEEKRKSDAALIVSQAAEADKKRRAQALANGRSGSVKTSPLGLPGGGFAQKTLLGS